MRDVMRLDVGRMPEVVVGARLTDRAGAREGSPGRAPLRARVGREVVVERSVLLDDEHDVLDRAVAAQPVGADPAVALTLLTAAPVRLRRGTARRPELPYKEHDEHDEEHHEAQATRGLMSRWTSPTG